MRVSTDKAKIILKEPPFQRIGNIKKEQKSANKRHANGQQCRVRCFTFRGSAFKGSASRDSTFKGRASKSRASKSRASKSRASKSRAFKGRFFERSAFKGSAFETFERRFFKRSTFKGSVFKAFKKSVFRQNACRRRCFFVHLTDLLIQVQSTPGKAPATRQSKSLFLPHKRPICLQL